MTRTIDSSLSQSFPLFHNDTPLASLCAHRLSFCSRLLQVPDHVCCFFCDHDSGCVGVASWQCRHDGSINHAQTLDSIDAQFRVCHCGGIGPHLARACRVIECFDHFAGIRAPLCIALNVIP